MLTFNHARIQKDNTGKTFLDLELQVNFPSQKIVIRNTFPATADYQSLIDLPIQDVEQSKSNNTTDNSQ